MADNRPQGQSRPKTILNDYAQPHPETEQPLQGAKFNGALRFEQKVNGEIVLRVYDNIWSDQKRQTREVSLNYNERGVLFDLVRQAADKSIEFSSAQYPVNQHSWVRENGQSKRTAEPINICNLIVARDEKGRVSLTYQKGDYSFKTVFRLHNVGAFKMRTADGQVVEDFGLPSRSSARAWCNFHEQLLNDMERAAWQPRQTNNNNGGGAGGGGNNWNRNNNGGGNSGAPAGGNGGGAMNQTTQDFDDDINW